MQTLFRWKEHHVLAMLPHGWQEAISQLVATHAIKQTLVPTSFTSRERSGTITIPTIIVSGEDVQEQLPWLYTLYETDFKQLGEEYVGEPLVIARGVHHGAVINVQKGLNMRYECHVDSNPLQGLLYVTTHREGQGGELVMSNNSQARGPEEIEEDCVRIYPQSGTLLLFDGRQFPHFVTSLTRSEDVRIAVAMNYYTARCPESLRPEDLDRHLGLG